MTVDKLVTMRNYLIEQIKIDAENVTKLQKKIREHAHQLGRCDQLMENRNA